MEEIPAGGVKLRHDLATSLNQSTLADLMAELGDKRELKSILRQFGWFARPPT